MIYKRIPAPLDTTVARFGNLAENSITRKIPFLSKKKSVVSQDAGDGVVGGPTGSGLSGNKDDYKKWAVSFDALLSSKQGVELFRLFLQREFSDENIEFWLACEEFKHLKGEKMTQKAKSIYTDFVAIQSHREVNLDSSTREQTIEAINTSPTSKHIFDNAQARIVALMDRDSYPRFLKSELYLNLAKS